MTIKTQITFKDYCNFYLKKIFTPLLTICLIALFCLFIRETITMNEQILQSFYFWFFICIVSIFILTMVRLRKAYFSNKRFQENLSYTFTNEKVHTKGETFEEEFNWSSVYSVNENKNWFMIYLSSYLMKIIPKKDFTKEQISELRNIIRSNQVKAKLRND